MIAEITKGVLEFLFDRDRSFWGDFLKKKPVETAELKQRTRVLFVDDVSPDALLKAIREAGWNVQRISDVTNVNEEAVRTADIVFMDYKGVGKILTPTYEGIGLMKHLRRNYPEKHIIFYSGHAGFIPGHEVHDLANGWIQKSADPFEYIDRIEQAARKLYG